MFVRQVNETIKKDAYWLGLRFPFLVLGAEILVTALAAACCAYRIAGVTVHAYFHIE
jgi:hypothetical protein